MNKDIDIRKVGNLLFYLVVGFVPLILLPINGTLEPAWTKLTFLALLGMLFIYISIRRRDSVQFFELTIENWFLLAYFLIVAISIFFSLEPMISIIGSGYRHDGLIALVLYIFSYLIARNTRLTVEIFFPLVTFTSTLIAIYGILQFYHLDPMPAEFYRLNWKGVAFSTMGNPNFLGSYLVLSIPVPIYLFFYKDRKYGLFAYSVLFLALLATRTRGAWIGAFAALIAYILLHHFSQNTIRKKLGKVIIVFLTSILVLLFFMSTTENVLMDRFLSIFADFGKILRQENDAFRGGSSRVYIWGKVIELIRMRPLFGYGLDTMYIAMETHFRGQIIYDFGSYIGFDKAHNEFLNIAVSSGIISLMAYLGFLFFTVRKGFRRLKYHPAYVPLLAAVIGYLIQAFFNIQVVLVYYLFFAYLGILTSKNGIVSMDEKSAAEPAA